MPHQFGEELLLPVNTVANMSNDSISNNEMAERLYSEFISNPDDIEGLVRSFLFNLTLVSILKCDEDWTKILKYMKSEDGVIKDNTQISSNFYDGVITEILDFMEENPRPHNKLKSRFSGDNNFSDNLVYGGNPEEKDSYLIRQLMFFRDKKESIK